jgi:hypothetical protein
VHLGAFVLDHDLGEILAAETGFLLARDPDTVRAADVAFVSKQRVAEHRFPGRRATRARGHRSPVVESCR